VVDLNSLLIQDDVQDFIRAKLGGNVQAAGSETVSGCVEEIGNFGSVRRKRRLRKEIVEESGVVATARFKEELFRGCAVVRHFVVAWEWICGWCQEVLFAALTRNERGSTKSSRW
jgi:hypothetical protein